jgi:hypothetical protein
VKRKGLVAAVVLFIVVEREWVARAGAEVVATSFVDDDGKPVDPNWWWGSEGLRLHPSVRGGGWMSEADECTGSGDFFRPDGDRGPAGIRLVWIED